MDNHDSTKQKVYHFTSNWFEPHLPQWQRLISEFATKPVNGLEIGSYEGRSTVWLLENVCTHQSSKLTTIDSFEGSPEFEHLQMQIAMDKIEERFRHNIAATGKANQVDILKGNSFELLTALNNDRINSGSPAQFDFIYIDASHQSDDVLSDSVLAWRLLKYNGIMIFDDYALRRYAEPFNNPYVGIDGFVAAFAQEIEILESNYQLAIRKVHKERQFTLIDFKMGMTS